MTIIPKKMLGDCRQELAKLPERCVHVSITSPPYWGLRAYGTTPVIWPLESDCDHEWGDEMFRNGPAGGQGSTSQRAGRSNVEAQAQRGKSQGCWCQKCGAWRGELGQEPTLDLFVEHIVEVFRYVRRVLRDDGTLWVNFGDSYNMGKAKTPGVRWSTTDGQLGWENSQSAVRDVALKPKDLCMVPARVAIALQADGWYLRSQIPWIKRNAMPESVTDRPATAVEYIYLFSKTDDYFYDRHAVMMGCSQNTHPRTGKAGSFTSNAHVDDLRGITPKSKEAARGTKNNASFAAGCSKEVVTSRNRRNSDWFMESWQGLLCDEEGEPLALIVNPVGTKIKHFAAYPPKLVEPMIKAGTSERGCCAKCGAPWTRTVGDPEPTGAKGSGNKERKFRDEHGGNAERSTHQGFGFPWSPSIVPTLGWQPSCECHGKLVRKEVVLPARMSKEDVAAWGADSNGEYNGQNQKLYQQHMAQPASTVKERIIRNATQERRVTTWVYESDLPLEQHPVTPCTVLDPFGGTNTTGEVATRLGRHSIACELSPEYFQINVRDSQTALALL